MIFCTSGEGTAQFVGKNLKAGWSNLTPIALKAVIPVSTLLELAICIGVLGVKSRSGGEKDVRA